MKLFIWLSFVWLLFGWSLVSGGAVAAADKPLIEWYVSGKDPYMITKGEFKGQGHGDVTYLRLQQKLSEYRHLRQITNRAYAQGGIRYHENVCGFDLLKNAERSQYMVFSKPILYLLPLGVITLAQNDVTGLVNTEGQFVLSWLRQQEQFILGIVAERSYGEALDKQLMAFPKGKNVLALAEKSVASDLLNLMKLKRIDASLGYVMEAYYLTKESKTMGQRLSYYPIAKQPPLLTAHVGCHQGEFGREVIKAINEKFDNDDIAIISQVYQRWLPENARKLYLKRLKANGMN